MTSNKEEFAIKWNGVWHLLQRDSDNPELLHTGRWPGCGAPLYYHNDKTFRTKKEALGYLRGKSLS